MSFTLKSKTFLPEEQIFFNLEIALVKEGNINTAVLFPLNVKPFILVHDILSLTHFNDFTFILA